MLSVCSTLLISALFHVSLGLLLAMIVIGSLSELHEPITYLKLHEPKSVQKIEVVEVELDPLLVDHPAGELAPLQVQSPVPKSPARLSPALREDVSLKAWEQFRSLADRDPWPGYNQILRKSFDARHGEMRSQRLKEHGGTPESERAVEEGLNWLVRHQNSDGSWSFDHRCEHCDDTCDGPGGNAVHHWTAGATALGVLCFLGAGHTHQEGNYQFVVRSALRYLINQRGGARTGGDYTKGGLHQGMYIQGFVGIALAEAYAMTHDAFLRPPAVAALDFIADAQHNRGGWRYRPNELGDTSVVGWQVMAITSGRVADLGSWQRECDLTMKYLDQMQSHGGSRYGYMNPRSAKPSTTAIGLLCRMYLGWDNRQALFDGVDYLSTTGPDPHNMYYNYYATQVLHHWGGNRWEKWNTEMRDQLISTQATTGHSQGSWSPNICRWAKGSSGGGRHYATCLGILTLEVYYRHLPLYQHHSPQSVPQVATEE